jgi:hypothetical protein
MRKTSALAIMATLGLSGLGLAACQPGGGEKAPSAETAQAPAAATPSGPPRRKPGLWSQTMVSEGMTQSTKICLDEATEAKMTIWGQQMGEAVCAKNLVTPTVGGWKVESECDFGGMGKNVTTGTVTGDFNSRYTMKMSTTTTGASMVQANGTSTMEMTATWEGACPADMKPGDMTLPGGVKMNLNDIAATPGQAGK